MDSPLFIHYNENRFFIYTIDTIQIKEEMSMKRSLINKVIKDMEDLLSEERYRLPPFGYWTPQDWQSKGHDYDEIRDNMLGWDVTDGGLGRFYEEGFVLFTIRNGNQLRSDEYPKQYAEKFLMMYPGQKFPMHYHIFKTEDIINRGSNPFNLRLYNGTPDRQLMDTDVIVSCDGHRMTLPAGSVVTLHPGESITITPYLFHRFEVPQDAGSMILLGEVSRCNDDNNDNFFYDEIGRFPKIDEDEAPYRLLCNEYPAAP